MTQEAPKPKRLSIEEAEALLTQANFHIASLTKEINDLSSMRDEIISDRDRLQRYVAHQRQIGQNTNTSETR